MNAHFYKKIEIAFWDFAIQTLSENKKVRSLIQHGYRVLRSQEFRLMLTWMGASAVAGLLSGFILYLLIGF